jgi:ribosomal protein S18 acetylase RimI-like enzyme
MLHGFFVGWPNPPSPATHLRILKGSAHVVLALEEGRVVGFVTALSDGVFYAYLSLLEVLPSHQGRGIGTALMQQVLEQLRQMYAVDVLCDPEVRPFYERVGMQPAGGMVVRNYARQSGE